MQSINTAKNSIMGRGIEFVQGALFLLIIAKCNVQLLCTNSAKDCRVQGSCCSGLLLRYDLASGRRGGSSHCQPAALMLLITTKDHPIGDDDVDDDYLDWSAVH